MTMHSPDRIRHAVEVVCAEIETRVSEEGVSLPSEGELWWELSCCVLSSQVPYALAVLAADAVRAAGFLESPGLESSSLAAELEGVLLSPLETTRGLRRYRFPATKALQLARAYQLLHAEGGIRRIVGAFENAAAARGWLVAHVPGLGPKQASMFLRNSGVSYRLAILDRHVLEYMVLQDLAVPGARPPAGMPAYLHQEARLSAHAETIGSAVGLLDWAIWIVMRTAKGLTDPMERLA